MELKLVKNFIYFHHLDKACLLPQYPESISDATSVTWTSTSLLQSSAPIQTWSNSGPRTVSFEFDLHREMLADVNLAGESLLGKDLISEEPETLLEDLVYTIEAAALPRYTLVTRLVNPPVVSVCIGKQIYIKGVVNSGVTHTFKGAIRDEKYNEITLSFSVTEITPYDAESIQRLGKFRGQTQRRLTNIL